MPRFLSRLSHLASKSLQHLVWVISPSQKLFFVRMIVGILHLHGRRLMRRLFVPSSLKFRPSRSVGFSPVIMRTAMTWPLMLSLPKLLSKGLIGTLFSMIFCPSLWFLTGSLQRSLLPVPLLQQNGSMPLMTLIALKTISIWLGRNSSCVMGQMLRSRVMTDLKELSFSLWRLPFVLRWNQICKVFLLITVVPSPCSASSSSIW